MAKGGGAGRGQGQGGQSPFQKGKGNKGPGLGGPGQGEGGIAPKEADDVGLEKTKLQGQYGKGRATVVGTFKGDPSKAAPSTEYGQAFSGYQQEADDALNKEEIPLGQKDAVRDYFESVRPKQGK